MRTFAPTEHYIGYYGVALAPFSTAPDRRFLYGSESIVQMYQQLVSAIRLREGVVVVAGESGLGKSVACRALLEDIVGPGHLSIVVNPFVTIEDLLRQVLADLEARPDPALIDDMREASTRHELLRRLGDALDRRDPSDSAVVMIDDAHQMAPETLLWLRVLSNLETHRAQRLQIVLVGQPALEVILARADMASLNERVARRCRIVRLSTPEIRAYVAHRLAVARGDGLEEFSALPAEQLTESASGPAPFSAGAIAGLAQFSRGVPRTVNLIAEQALRLGCERQLQEIRAPIVRDAASGLRLVRFSSRERRRAIAGMVVTAMVAVAAIGLWRLADIRAIGRASTAVLRRPTTTQRVALPAAPALISTPPVEASIPREPLARVDAHLVIAGSFRNERNASNLAVTLRDAGLPAFTDGGSANGWFAVVVGPYASHEEARTIQQQLEQRFALIGSQVRVER